MMKSFTFLFLILSFICNSTYADKKAYTKAYSGIKIEAGVLGSNAYEYGIKSSTNDYKPEANFWVSVGILCNYSGETYNGPLRMALFSSNGTLKSFINLYEVTINNLRAYETTTKSSIKCVLPESYEETDYIAAVTKGYGSERNQWTEVNGDAYTQHRLYLKDADYGLINDEMMLTHMEGDYSGKEVIGLNNYDIKIGETVYFRNGYMINVGGDVFNGEIGVASYNYQDEMLEVVSTQQMQVSELPIGKATNISSIPCVFSSASKGKCYLSLCYRKAGHKDWHRVKAMPTIKSKIAIENIRNNDLQDITSICYDKNRKEVCILTERGIHYYLYDKQEKIQLEGTSNQAGEIILKEKDLPEGVCELNLQRGAEKIYVNIKFK